VKPRFFQSAHAFRAWLDEHHDTATELLVGFHKRHTARPSMTWPESVDQALCFGWIDGVRKRIDDDRYTIRFTPRKPSSIWSAVNIRRATELASEGWMHPAGLRAFQRRKEDKSRVDSYENAPRELPPEFEQRFRANGKAWMWFTAQAPWYRRVTTAWVVSARKEETRERRLKTLIDDSAHGRRVGVTEVSRSSRERKR